MPPLAPTLDLTAADLNLAIIGQDGLAVTFTFDIDLTDYTVRAEVVGRKSRETVQVIDAELVQENPGVVTIALLGDETEPLTNLALDWWLVLAPAGGEERTVLQGHFAVGER